MSRVLIVAILVILLAACSGPVVGDTVIGSGNLVSRSFPLKGFSEINANSGAQVEVTRAGGFTVEVQVDDNVEPMLDLSVVGDTLRIRLDVDSQINVTLRVLVTMPELTGVTLNGGSTLQGELAGEDLDTNLNGGSRTTLTGTAGRVTIEANGGSRALLGNLAAGDVHVTANGGSHVEINASGEVTGQANGGSQVGVGGSPTSVDVDTNGGAQVTTK
jgi:hypothetical protein